ncbi:MAG: AraC family transcriptional regulator ligand-binding domain-containing protein [Aquabacterium sp.]
MRVSPINLKILAYTLDVEGHDSGAVLARCGYASIDEIPENGPWVPLSQFDQMMHAAAEVTGDPAFGLVAGKSIALMKYGALTPLALSTPTLRQLLDDITRFAPLAIERSELELVETASTARLDVLPVIVGGISGHFRTEQVATSAVQMLRFVGAVASDIHLVEFPYDEPTRHADRYRATFGPRMRFGSRQCAITFNPALLDARLPTHDPVAYVAARTRAESVMAALKSENSLAESVRQLLLGAYPRQPSVAETAQHVGMSERSFRRQLGMLGTSHAELAQECLQLTAERLLAEGRLPLKQIAEELGFASVHSFHRAFRRWTGLTPSAWRENQGAPLPDADRAAG